MYFVCPNCKYKITDSQWNQARFDYKCPKCKKKILSQFSKESPNDKNKS